MEDSPYKYGTPEYGKWYRDQHKERLAKIRYDKYHGPGKKKYLRRRDRLNRYKTSKGCSECGYNFHAVALDFDHTDPKEKKFNISQRLAAAPLKTIFKEIRKCVILCANCHRVKTMKEKQFDQDTRTR